MTNLELKAERVRQNKSSEYMGKVIGKNGALYRSKEKGKVGFKVDEIIAIVQDLKLSPEKLDLCFFDGMLQFGK